MNGTLADVIGLIGSAVMVIAYAYSNVARRIDLLFFNLLNLIGAVLLITSLSVHFNLASMALEIVWMGIAGFGTAKAWIARRAA